MQSVSKVKFNELLDEVMGLRDEQGIRGLDREWSRVVSTDLKYEDK